MISKSSCSEMGDRWFSWNAQKRPTQLQDGRPEFTVPFQHQSLCISQPYYRDPLKEHCAFSREIYRPKTNPIRDAVSAILLESDGVFNAPVQFLVVRSDSAARRLCKCLLAILSLWMGSGLAISRDTSLKTDECDLTLNQISTSSHAEDSRPSLR